MFINACVRVLQYPLTLFVSGLLVLAYFLHIPKEIFLILCAFSGIILIVFGEPLFPNVHHRWEWFFTRETVVSSILLLLCIIVGLIPSATVISAFEQNIAIILFICCLAFMSHGLAKSGLFAFIAYHFIQHARGNTVVLITLTYVLASILGYLTTNDITIIVLTPIIFSIVAQSNIRNGKLLFVGEFIAANTAAMGLPWGSPTNIIIAQTMHINFPSYVYLMTIPCLIASVTSLGIIYMFARLTTYLPKSWQWDIAPTYEVPLIVNRYPFTKVMAYWIILFTCVFSLVTYALGNNHVSLFVVDIVGFLGSIALLWQRTSPKPLQEVTLAFKRIPYGILFFALFYFSVAKTLSDNSTVLSAILPFMDFLTKQTPVVTSFLGTLATSLLVNTMCDIPSSIFISALLPHMTWLSSFTHVLLLQSILIGLNIGTYLTSVGALAGIIWFSIIKTEKERHKDQIKQELITPKRIDLVVYGSLQFIPVALVTAIISTVFLILTYSHLGK